MSKRVKLMVFMLWRLYKSGFITFWLIFTGFYLLLILWGAFRSEIFPSAGTELIGGLGALFAYLFYTGFSTVRSSFARAPQINTTREEYYLAILAWLVLMAGLTAAIQTTAYLMLENMLAGTLSNIGEIYYFSFHGMNHYSNYSAFTIHFITALFLLTTGLGLGVMHYRWGKLFLYPALAIGVLGLLQTNLDWWIELFRIEPDITLGSFTLGLTVASVIAMLLGWVVLWRAPVK